jgi:hypothetical protein
MSETDYWESRSKQFCDGIKGVIARRGINCWRSIEKALDTPIAYAWGCELRRTGKITAFPAVYFVVRNDEVIYVGKSANPRKRWMDHDLKKRVDDLAGIDIFWLQPYSGDVIGRWEEYFIWLLEPIYNRRSMPKERTGRYFFGEPEQASKNLDDLLNRLEGGEFG